MTRLYLRKTIRHIIENTLCKRRLKYNLQIGNVITVVDREFGRWCIQNEMPYRLRIVDEGNQLIYIECVISIKTLCIQWYSGELSVAR